ncbi:MAG: hypothetical protein C0425_10820 [Chlorobiaceae bacterium]|nr:hypothetical protein [Chlorobiaceae bacterium]
MKKVIIVSFFKSDNLGDLKIANEITKLVENRELKYVKYDFLEVEKLSGEFDLYEEKSSEILLRNGRIKKILKEIFSKIISKKYLMTKKQNFKKFEEELKNVDGVIIGGGNMFMDISPVWPMLINEYVKLAKKQNKKVVVTSVGVGPVKYKYNQKIIRSIVKKTDYFSVRDEKSLEEITYIIKDQNMKIKTTRDPVFMLAKNSSYANFSNVVGVSVLGHTCFDNEELFDTYIKQILQLISSLSGKEIVLFSTEKSDYPTIKAVSKKLKKEYSIEVSIVNIKELKDLKELYSKCEFLIGGRMHAMIFAHTQNIPHFGFDWQRKIKGYGKSTETLIFEISKNKTEMKKILDHISFLINFRAEQVNKIKAKNYEIKKIIEAEFDLIKTEI